MSDLGLLIVTPFIIGFVGERFKDMQTWLYGIFIVLFFVALEFYHYVTVGAPMFGNMTCNLLSIGGTLFALGLFHLQKKIRHKK